MKLIHAQITLTSIYPSQHIKSKQLFEIAQSLGFDIITTKNQQRAVLYDAEAEDIKNQLRSYGIADKDFQIRLEYQRGWGFL